MRQLYNCILLLCFPFAVFSQTPKTYTSSEILLQLKKLNVLGSVLYIAAHPDDENTRLLAYLANEKLYRTGYLSLTRGDGGQNLIGDEQGIDLGLIRTQELLAARRIDGAEQFFSRAYDFGFCKSSEEALSTWGHDKILSDVVWVVRKFRPDVIICRFPEDSRAGHGHHAASGILAREAFDAAADSTKFPEQFKQGVTVWQAKRMLWNTFNFGNTNTQNENQFKLDVGMYNPLLGKSYGEIAALSRSQHKSQGFGVPAQRGSVIEYFETIKGDKPVNDLMDGVDVSWKRAFSNNTALDISKGSQFADYVSETVLAKADLSLPNDMFLNELVRLYNNIEEDVGNEYWKKQKSEELKKIIESYSGIFLEATAPTQFAVQGDTIRVTVTANNRIGLAIKNVSVHIFNYTVRLDTLKSNINTSKTVPVFIKANEKLSQPYWLENKMDKGSFIVDDQKLIGKAENDPLNVEFALTINNKMFTLKKPIRYKFTDPVKGEIYQPVNVIPSFSVRPLHAIKYNDCSYELEIRSFKDNNTFHSMPPAKDIDFSKGDVKKVNIESDCDPLSANGSNGSSKVISRTYKAGGVDYVEMHQLNFDHIPTIVYTRPAVFTSIFFDLKTAGKTVGYIPGAGDKVPQALEQMGYKIVMLKEGDIYGANLKQFDAIVTGVRAYNTNEWMNNVYDALMEYVKEGGVLVNQYNTSSQIGPVKAKMAPYNFNISRNRITDETAKVNFLLPEHPALNYPNKITEKDFEGWIQERSIYNAEKIDSNYQRVLSMKDPGEADQDGSLIVGNYGKGKYVYTGLVFFRELPAGVPGAYRLFANLLAPPKTPGPENSKSKSSKNTLLNKTKLSGKSSKQ